MNSVKWIRLDQPQFPWQPYFSPRWHTSERTPDSSLSQLPKGPRNKRFTFWGHDEIWTKVGKPKGQIRSIRFEQLKNSESFSGDWRFKGSTSKLVPRLRPGARERPGLAGQQVRHHLEPLRHALRLHPRQECPALEPKHVVFLVVENRVRPGAVSGPGK